MRVIKEFKEEHLHVQILHVHLLKNELQVLKTEYIHILLLRELLFWN